MQTDHTDHIKGFMQALYHHGDTIPPIEDVLSLIDDALLQNRPLTNEYSIEKLRATRLRLILAISDLLKFHLEDHNGEFTWSEATNHFANCLQPSDVTITTNYDLILDNAISKRAYHYGAIDYGADIRYFYEFHSRDFQQQIAAKEAVQTDQQIKLLKLHGSLNWLYCPICQAIDITVGMKGVTLLRHAEMAPKCPYGHGYVPLLIAPTLLKSYDNPFISTIWRQSEDALAQADKIVIAGYSLPQADIIFRTRLIRALARNHDIRRSKGLSPVQMVVVDRPYGCSVEETTRRDIAKQHFERILGPQISFEPIGFEQYVLDMVRNPVG